MQDDLRTAWAQTLRTARTEAGATNPTSPETGPEATPETNPEAFADNLLARWSEPQRRYHTTTHLKAVLDHIDVLEDHAEDPELVRLAAWFHDAVYLPERSANEERSARLAERALAEAGLADRQIDEVSRLVLLTVDHDPAEDDHNGEVLCDADLAILAAAPDAYAAYAAAVREEYGFVPDEPFRDGRAAVLRQLLALPRLFRTPYGAAHWEEPARENLNAELALLTPQTG
ncbi:MULTISPECIES: hypothetical protein [unclassified Streptomyces]|uniref:HD domain-containing protein n=1 Tax=unclassified Streptomyces TaxID=2593676 RepID=UPI0036EE888D